MTHARSFDLLCSEAMLLWRARLAQSNLYVFAVQHGLHPLYANVDMSDTHAYTMDRLIPKELSWWCTLRGNRIIGYFNRDHLIRLPSSI